MGRKIQSEAQGEMERMQRDFFLREQIKAIQKELGEEDEQAADIRELEERITAAGMTEEADKEAAASWTACGVCRSRPPNTA